MNEPTDNQEPPNGGSDQRLVRLVGELHIDSQEGGYASPSITIRTGEKRWTSMEELLQDLIGIPDFEDGNTGKTVEITARIIEPNAKELATEPAPTDTEYGSKQ